MAKRRIPQPRRELAPEPIMEKRAADLGDKARLVEAGLLAMDQIRSGAWHFRDRYDDAAAQEAIRRFADFVAFHLEDVAIEVAQRCGQLGATSEGGA